MEIRLAQHRSRCLVRFVVPFLFFYLLACGGSVSAQTPAIPVDATPEQLKKIKDEANARKDALDALAAEVTARKALTSAQDTTKPPFAEQTAAAKAAKDLADAQKAQADAEKAQADAALAAAKAKFGEIPVSGYTGTAEMGANAGNAEAMLLGSVAVRKIAETMAASLKANKPADLTKLLLFTSTTVPDFQALLAFNAQRDAFKFAFDNAKESTKGLDSVALAASVATVGLALDAFNKVLGYFKADYKFQGIEIASSDGMLLAALASELRAVAPTQVPVMYQPAPPASASGALDAIAEPFNWAQQATERMRRHEEALPDLEKQLSEKLKIKADDKAKPEDRAKAEADARVLQQRLQRVKDAVALWKALADRLGAWTSKLGTADDKGNVPLANVVRQAALRADLDGGAALVVIQLHRVAGTAYTKKNLWSSLGFNPFFVMGGAVASMTAFHGKTGNVFSSTLQPWHGGYHSVSDIEAVVNK